MSQIPFYFQHSTLQTTFELLRLNRIIQLLLRLFELKPNKKRAKIRKKFKAGIQNTTHSFHPTLILRRLVVSLPFFACVFFSHSENGKDLKRHICVLSYVKWETNLALHKQLATYVKFYSKTFVQNSLKTMSFRKTKISHFQICGQNIACAIVFDDFYISISNLYDWSSHRSQLFLITHTTSATFLHILLHG